MYFFILMFVIVVLVNFISVNVVVWWSMFVISVVIFVWLAKIEGGLVSMVNYYVIQEGLGLVFLFFGGCFIQFVILMVKGAFSPFHFWIFSLGADLSGVMLMWFMVMQKIPFVPVIVSLFESSLMVVLLVGLLVCHVQYLMVNSDKGMVMISSTESMGWMVLVLCWGYYGFILLVSVYIVMMLSVLGWVMGEMSGSLNWGLVLVFMNFPMGLVFMVKYFSLSLVSVSSYLLLVMFFSVVGCYLCLMLWVVGMVMVNSGSWHSKLCVCFVTYVSVLVIL